LTGAAVAEDANGFDNVAQIARGIPKRLGRLRVAGIVGRANLELVAACRELHRQLPFAERIFSEILAEFCRCPALSAIDRDCDFLDALAAVEGDPLQRRSARLQFCAMVTLVMKERTVKRLIGIVAFGAVPGSMHPHGVSGIR
jgi:hypothetical protein